MSDPGQRGPKRDSVLDETVGRELRDQPVAGHLFVRTVHVYDVLDSSNDHAAELVADPAAALPLIVRAREQKRGRGRGSNTWWSDAGSLMFTLAIDPVAEGLSRELEPRLALGMAVAIIDAIAEFGLQEDAIGIRWPNDIEIRGLKLAGILPESVETPLGRRVLIGVGVNVSTDLRRAPEDVGQMATSLERLSGRTLSESDQESLMWLVLKQFELALRRLVDGDRSLAERWMELDRLKGSWVVVDQGPSIVTGWARGIDGDGALLVDQAGLLVTIVGGHVLRA